MGLRAKELWANCCERERWKVIDYQKQSDDGFKTEGIMDEWMPGYEVQMNENRLKQTDISS